MLASGLAGRRGAHPIAAAKPTQPRPIGGKFDREQRRTRLNIGSILSSILPASASQASPASGLGTLAIERQAIVQTLAIKQQAQAEQAVANMIAQATQQAAQSTQGSGTVPPRGSTVNILV
jgi:hypothetical protein